MNDLATADYAVIIGFFVVIVTAEIDVVRRRCDDEIDRFCGS